MICSNCGKDRAELSITGYVVCWECGYSEIKT